MTKLKAQTPHTTQVGGYKQSGRGNDKEPVEI